MTGKEILLSALRGETTPRPAWVPFVGVHGGKMIGATASNYLQSSDLIVQGLTAACQRYRPDGLPVVFDLQIEAEILGCGMHWADDTPPAVTLHPLANGSLANLPAFDGSKGRLPIVAEALRTMKKRTADEVAFYGLVTGPFTLALHLMGTNIFLEMFNDPGKVKAVVSHCAEVGRQAADVYLDNGADVIALVDPMTSQISPAHFAEFAADYVDEVFDHVHQRRALASLFVCGNATRNLEAMCRTRTENISVDENIDLAYLRDLARASGKSFGGNLKLTTVLLLGDEDSAKLDAIRCIDIGGDAGFILAPGCDLPYATPEQNIAAAATMVHDPYQRDIVRVTARRDLPASFDDVELPDYHNGQHVIVDVVTLDSASCAPCQYMVDAVRDAAREIGERVEIREHKITTRSGLGHMAKLGVGQIPTICIDGQVMFPSLIPDVKTLADAIRNRLNQKTQP